MSRSGVYPVYDNVFSIGTKGAASVEVDMVSIAELETFSVNFDNGIEEWTPMTTEGWLRRLQTAKAFDITLSGKRNIGDKGNDYCASLAWKSGRDVETKFEWTMPDGTVIATDCLINVSNVGGGDSTNVAGLEISVMSNGKPTITVPTVPTPPAL